MGRYAKNTTVSVSKSKEEIEKVLSKYGADQFISGWDTGTNQAMLGFRFNAKMVRFTLPMPAKEDFKYDKREYERAAHVIEKDWEKACRQRWRALALVVKAKLEAVEVGIATFEEEFLAHILLPDGQTVGSWAVPQIEAGYAKGKMPKLLPMGPGA